MSSGRSDLSTTAPTFVGEDLPWELNILMFGRFATRDIYLDLSHVILV